MKRNPGEKLRDFLKEIYPSERPKGIFEQVDYDLQADGELEHLLYESCIHYLVRRLITTARYFHRKYPEETWPGRSAQELRQHLRDYTRYRDRHVDRLVQILKECIRSAERKPTATERKRIRKRAEYRSHSCYVCGQELDYAKKSKEPNAASVDHRWPRSLGGTSDQDNLSVACRDCDNRFKRDYLGGSDHHYEQISLVAGSYDEFVSKHGERQRRRYETAVFAHGDFCCQYCGTPAYRCGQLMVGRKDQNDSWHFLNLAPFCQQHRPAE